MARTRNPIPQIVPVSMALSPRLTLTVCPTDRFKIGTFSLYAQLPDTPELLPSAALLLPVLRRGTREYPTQELINRHLDDLYAADCRIANACVGDVRCLGFVSDLPESRVLPGQMKLLPDILALMVQLFFDPLKEENGSLSARYIEAERKNLLETLEALINYPAAYANSRFRAAFMQDRGCGEPLTPARIRELPTEQLQRLLENICNHAHFHAFYIGQTPPDEIAALLTEQLMPRLQTSSGAPCGARPRVLSPRPSVLSVHETLHAGQSHLLMGYRTPITMGTPEFYAMMLCNELLGGSPISRLFTQLREKKSLCYSCQSEYLSDRGELIVSCGIDRASRDAAQNEIIEQIAALQRGEFDSAELEGARALLLGGYTQLDDSTRALASFYRLRYMLGLDQTVEDCRRAIAAVTAEEVVAAARSLCCDTVYFLEGTATEEGADDEYDDAT